MAISLGRNVQALRAERALSDAQYYLSRTFERLSSGQRINRAGDDAAGLAASTALDARSRVFSQGIRNVSDGISLLNIADGALTQLGGIVGRIRELAAQASSGSFSLSQRSSLNEEAQTLAQEYFRIARSTTFNGRNLFSGDFGTLRIQGGFGVEGGIASSLGGAVGTAQFSSSGSTTISSGASGVASGDVNNDGKLDIVSTGFGVGTVSLGTGAGTFVASATFATEASSYDVELADFNGDGKLDVVTTGRTAGQDYVTLSIGNGDGTFGAAQSTTMPLGGVSLAVGDINRDGNIDVVTAGQSGMSYGVSARLGNGDGTFGSAVSIALNAVSLTEVRLGDIDGDDILDIVTGVEDPGGGGAYMVNLGHGDGTFEASLTAVSNDIPNDFQLTDVNNDGGLDIVGIVGTPTVEVLLNTGNGTFGASRSLSYDLVGGGTLSVGDLNGDGNVDIVASDLASDYAVYLGAGDGSFSLSSTASGGVLHTLLGDFNNDGVLDLAGATSTTVKSLTQSTAAGISPLLPFDLSYQYEALQALPFLEQAANRISLQRGTLGAFQARLESSLSTLTAARENLEAASSRIRDVDIAQESAELIRLNILRDTSSAILGSANQQSQLVLQLLGAA